MRTPASLPALTLDSSPANGWNAEYLAALHEQYRADPGSVPADVRSFMQGFDLALASGPNGTLSGSESTASGANAAAPSAHGPASGPDSETSIRRAVGVARLIDAYRAYGHLASDIDPFHRPRAAPAQLTLEASGLTSADLDSPVPAYGLPLAESVTLGAVVGFLKARYTGSTGYQFGHIADPVQRQWFIDRIERDPATATPANSPAAALSSADRLSILECLLRSEMIERFLQKRYQGQKRFSLEGGEALIPLLEWIIRSGSAMGVEEIVMGMPHRGRLNVLNNILGKTYQQVFTEFEHNWHHDFVDGGGDVKYHRGYSGARRIKAANGRPDKTVALTLSFNPSHLEAVNGVVAGRCRAKQRLRGDTAVNSAAGTRARRRVLPINIHGDAAVIAQGVVAEVLTFSQLEGYCTGGTIHIVVNNLVGFTTDADDARTSTYCTDIGLIIEAPAIHVNGDDPEQVVAVAMLAVEYRQHFGRDIFIDLLCYRKYGHNELDNAAITQPILTALIKNDAGVRAHYSAALVQAGLLTEVAAQEQERRLEEVLEAAQRQAIVSPTAPQIDPAGQRWTGFTSDYSHEPAVTAASAAHLREVCAALGTTPADWHINPVVSRIMAARAALAGQLGATDGPLHLTYADAESFAFGTLLLEGTAVRISGQDSCRGTFSHRHAVVRHGQTAAKYIPLNAMRPIADLPESAGKANAGGVLTQARMCVYDSPLSEYGVMGFDYGYSTADPNMLVCWEGQFGDFCNTAQVVIDQFIASAEIKWNRWSGLVLLLPHGYEGAGPEHSSARLERFLQLCADDNMQVIYPSTGAQIFHALRRQARRNFRKPLIVMTPKSMLRLPTSRMDDLVTGRFEEIIDDPHFVRHKEARRQVSRVLFCTGKFYHELEKRRDDLKRFDTAIIRIEQYYPFHHDLAKEIMGRYPAKVRRYWAQEEPRNAGAFTFMTDIFQNELKVDGGLAYIGRDSCATTAVGDTHVSDAQQETIITEAIGPAPAAAPSPAATGTSAATPAKSPAPIAAGKVAN